MDAERPDALHEHRARGWLRRRLARRQLLRSGAFATLGLLSWKLGSCTPPKPPRTDRWMSEWIRHARIANAVGLGEHPEEPEMRYIIASLKEQYVTVAETDTVLSDWLTDEEFAEIMAPARSSRLAC